MTARIYFQGRLVGLTDIAQPERGRIAVNDVLTVVLVEEHPRPDDKPLFLEGRIKTA